MEFKETENALPVFSVVDVKSAFYRAAGRIPGAIKMATIWLIPKDAEKPVDMRTKQGKELKNAKDTLC